MDQTEQQLRGIALTLQNGDYEAMPQDRCDVRCRFDNEDEARAFGHGIARALKSAGLMPVDFSQVPDTAALTPEELSGKRASVSIDPQPDLGWTVVRIKFSASAEQVQKRIEDFLETPKARQGSPGNIWLNRTAIHNVMPASRTRH